MKLTSIFDVTGDTLDDKLTNIVKSAHGTIYIQPKHNGIHAVYSDGRMWTRDNKQWKREHFDEYLWDMLACAAPNGSILYGELMIPDIPFQESCGRLSVNRKPERPEEDVVFYAYDLFQPTKSVCEQDYATRLFWLDRFVKKCYTNLIELCETTKIANCPNTAISLIKEAFKIHVDLGFEGIVIRANPAYLMPSGRCPQIIKWKHTLDGEGICVEVLPGKGKRMGILGAFVIQLPSGVTFKLGGGKGLTDVYLAYLWQHPPIGKQITFAYEALSTAGIPLKPQFVAVRDYER